MLRAVAAVAISAFVLCPARLVGQPSQESSKPALPAGHPQPEPQPQLPPGHPAPPSASPHGQAGADWPAAKAEDVDSLDSILKAYYASTSGPKGQPREWDRYRSLFAPDARLIVVRPGVAEGMAAGFLTVNDFVETNKRYFERGGFIDKEVARRTDTFGAIAQVWSTYESRHNEAEAQPYTRGITSIQLLKSGPRWYILSVFWQSEGPDVTIPERYLSSPKE